MRALLVITAVLFLQTSLPAQTTSSAASSANPPAASPTTAPLAQRLDAIFDAPKWESARWGVMVQDVETSEVLYQRDAEKSFMPASNMKLYTTAASLASLGADYRFETKIYATGTTDTEGTLKGNIYIVGSGDPSISGRYLEDKPTTAILTEWADAISSMGIRRIEGDIIGDDDIFDDSALAGTWSVSYLQEWYAAENSGLAMNDNCWDINVHVGERPERGLRPVAKPVTRSENGKHVYLGLEDPLQTKYYNISIAELEVEPNDDPPTSAPEEEARFNIERNYESNNIQLSGSIEEDSAPAHEWGSISNGTLFTATLVKEELERKRINVSGNAVDVDEMDKQVAQYVKANPGTLVHTHVSPPLSKILAIVNKPSQNFYADMLLKVVGAKTHGLGTWNNGEKVVEDLLTTAGVESSSLNMSDGSGLSRMNMVAPRQTVALLNYMQNRPDFAVFEASLPIMGVDGTLKSRMAGTPAEGNVKAKTGTIGMVRALSGYMTANNGHRLVFSMMANNYDTQTSEATEAQNQAIMELMNP